MGPSKRDSECEAYWKHRSIMDEIYISHDQVTKWAKAKVLVYSDSVLCLGKIQDRSEANRRWEGQVTEFRLSTSYGELLGIDGELIEFECNIFPGFTSLQILQKIQTAPQERNIEPEQLGDRIIFISVQRYRLDDLKR